MKPRSTSGIEAKVENRSNGSERSQSPAIMTTLPWLLIPGFSVPLFFAVHIAIFTRLMKVGKAALDQSAAV